MGGTLGGALEGLAGAVNRLELHLRPVAAERSECPLCGHPITAMSQSALFAAMAEHDVWHDRRLQSPEPVCDTKTSKP